jgi:sodium/potassium-transporting ATPase subunit alpha
MERTFTQEDRELAQAGYEHLDTSNQNKKDSKDDSVDITEHKLSFTSIESTLQITFDPKDASKSLGLTEQEAKNRLERDGPNILTPPKKRSALMKVRVPRVTEFQ